MKRGLLFSISGLMIAGAFFWTRPATDTAYYEPREESYSELSAKGYFEYLNYLRSNPTTGNVEAADIANAKQQLAQVNKSSSALGLQWTFMGPDDIGGRTRALLFDKDNPSIMYACGVAGGIFRSPNGGRSWISVDDNLDNMAFVSLAQSADGTIYAGTGEDMYYAALGRGSGGIMGEGMYKSTDGGQTFSLMPSTDPSNAPGQGWTAVGKIACDPNNANRIYAATDDGLQISNDAGATWTTESSGITRDLIVTPSGAVWAKIGSRIFKSNTGDAGTYFEITTSGGDINTNIQRDASRMMIAVSPQDENYAYILVTNGSNFSRVYQSTDGGGSWNSIGEVSSLLNMIDQSPFAVAFNVDRYNKERIMVAGLTLWEWSKDNGWFQIAVQGPTTSPFYVHVDMHDIQWHPVDTNTLFVTTDGGIFKSTNNGFSWTDENKGYGTTQYYDLDVALDDKIMGGTQDNGTILIDPHSPLPKSGTRTIGITQPNGQTFDGDGANTEFSHLDPEVWFKTTQYGRIGRSIDAGGEFSYFYGNRMAGRYNNFSFAFANFVTPFTLWEKLEDRNSIDSIAFVADTIKLSIGFGNGNTRYSGQFTKPQSSTKFVAESFKVFSGAQVAVSDASGNLSGDGTGTFDPVTGQFTVDFLSGTALEIRATVATSYDPGAIIVVESETGDIPITEVIPNGLNPSDTFLVQDHVQSMFAVGLTAYDNPSQPGNLGGGVWMARNVLSDRTQTPEWWHIGNMTDGEVPSCMAFSEDGDALYVGTNGGRVYRYSNLTNARTEESADVDINFLVNPPAPSNAVVIERVVFAQPGRAVTNIVPDTEDPDRVIITLGNYGGFNHVFYTENATSSTLSTANFTAKDGNLPDMPVYDAVFNYNDPNQAQVVLATEFGTFTTDDITAGTVQWTQEINGMANVPVFDLHQTRTVRYDLASNTDFEGAIYAGTHGRGVYKTGSTADYVSIEETDFEAELPQEALGLYPNPANNKVSVELALENRSDVKINVRDMSGKLVKAISYNDLPAGTESLSIDVSTLKNGNYVISVIQGQEVKTGKLIVRH
jgi:photosystem II stability/assembly factor-like uncharacterized protein